MASTATLEQRMSLVTHCQTTPLIATEETTSLQTSHLAPVITTNTILLMLHLLAHCGECLHCHYNISMTGYDSTILTITWPDCLQCSHFLACVYQEAAAKSDSQ